MKIRDIRVSRCLTQKDLANRLKVERTTVSMWENGYSSPNVKVLKQIAEILECKVDDLID